MKGKAIFGIVNAECSAAIKCGTFYFSKLYELNTFVVLYLTYIKSLFCF